MTSGAIETTVARRAVFHVGGYERNDARRFFSRFGKELARFAACWSVEAVLGPVAFDEAGRVASARIDCRDGAGRETRTDFVLLDYDDIVKADGARPLPVRFRAWLAAFLDYVVTGTMFRFFAANWRFALYFLYPLLGLVGPVLLGWLVWRCGQAVPVPGAGVLAALLGAALAVLLVRRLARRFFLFHLMDLWSFSREWLRGRRPGMDERVAVWARAIDARVRAGGYDEVALVGHSTGGAIILDVAAHYAGLVAARGEAPAFSLLTVGSTGPKVTLHPAAKGARARLRALVAHPGVDWGDFQAVADVINFYRCDPLKLAGIPNPRPGRFPLVGRVRFKPMLDKEFYRGIRYNVFRVHYQFISANTKRYRYDFFMMCCGPHPLRATMRGSLVPRNPGPGGKDKA
jgi:pimeloyl-ACP methyl ester carboxylesterase